MPEGPILPASGTGAGAAGSGSGNPLPAGHRPPGETAKETVISVIIAFALAFVFRGFVIEAFVIPTGSMAPTLRGQHMQFHDRYSGYDWPVTPWQFPMDGGGRPLTESPFTVQQKLSVSDPMSGALNSKTRAPLCAGDRILVLKYLYAVMDPERFDVVVFKNPAQGYATTKPQPTANYIKRLVGLPGEQIALIDGDVFVRTPGKDEAGKTIDPATFWELPGWKIARKPALVQRAVWQKVFDSSHAPMPPQVWFQQPWVSKDSGWSFSNPRVYEYKGGGPTKLAYDDARIRFNDPGIEDYQRRDTWRITDRYAYNEQMLNNDGRGDPWQINSVYPVSDVRVYAGIEPMAGEVGGGGAFGAELRLGVRAHEYKLEVREKEITLSLLEPAGSAGITPAESSYKKIGSAAIESALKPGSVTNVELWHVDQSVSVYINDELVLGPIAYDWSPAARIRYSTSKELREHLKVQAAMAPDTNVFANPGLYGKPSIEWTLTGPARLYRVGVDRDLHYRASEVSADENRRSSPGQVPGPALGTSPYAPLTLKADQFFFCGDNSPQSLDGRLWGLPDPWIAREFSNDAGVVPRELILGKAFFVYWPSLIKERGVLPVPDFGRMRFIW